MILIVVNISDRRYEKEVVSPYGYVIKCLPGSFRFSFDSREENLCVHQGNHLLVSFLKGV